VRGLSLFIAGLIVALSGAVPMLEAGVVSHGIAFEAEHTSDCHLSDHDHSICVQHG